MCGRAFHKVVQLCVSRKSHRTKFFGGQGQTPGKPLPIAGPQGICVGGQMLPTFAIGQVFEGIFQQGEFMSGFQGFQRLGNTHELGFHFAPVAAGLEPVFDRAQGGGGLGGVTHKQGVTGLAGFLHARAATKQLRSNVPLQCKLLLGNIQFGLGGEDIFPIGFGLTELFLGLLHGFELGAHTADRGGGGTHGLLELDAGLDRGCVHFTH